MQILIKSFNRPYYLDRCLASIEMYLIGYEKVIIMDDGTPQIYLDKIKQKYPFIDICYSDGYTIKQKSILEQKSISAKAIPTKLWNDCAKKTSNYFVMIEDDMWFTSKIILNELNESLLSNKVQMFKLFWLGNSKLVDYQDKKKINSIELCQPKKNIFNRFYFYWIYCRLQRLNKIKIFLGIYDKNKLLDYYSIYGVAGMIFKKDYYLALWRNNQAQVDEMQQLLCAIDYLKSKFDYPVAKPIDELLKTGFISAATNSNKEHYKHHTDMFVFNNLINQLWFKGDFDVLENFPNDFSKNYILKHLDIFSPSFAENWLNWHEEFKQQYIKLGCIL